MPIIHEPVRDPSVDIYGLHLFRLVAETGSFTRAGRLAGLTQSAITRQIQNVEARLGVPLLEQRWLLPDRRSNTGRGLRAWLEEVRLPVRAAMELDSFDLIINLVALGVGVSFVPHRALPLYVRRRRVRRISTIPRFSRELVVVTSWELPAREHVRQFVECILF